MSALLSVFRIRRKAEFQYRGAMLGGVVCQLVFGLILVAIYRALYETRPQELPLQQVVSYVWIQQAFFRMLLSSDSELNEKIAAGSIAYDLCRPINLYAYYYTRDMAIRMVGSLMRAVPLLTIAVLLPEGWGLSEPASFPALICALISLLLGLFCVCALSAIGHAFTLITLDGRGIEAMLNLLLTTFSGNLLPLTLFPESWQLVIRVLPYAQLLDVPARIYTGSQPLSGVPLLWLMQLLWIVILILFGLLLWKKNEKRLVLQGG